MRIVHLAETLGIGGAEVLVSQLCRRQRMQGHDSSVHCLFEGGILTGELEQERCPVVIYEEKGKWQLLRALRCRFASMGVDVVHCHNATATILGAPAAYWAGVRGVVSTRHGLVPPPYHPQRERLYGAASRCCGRVVAVCRATQRNLENAPWSARDRIVTVYNGTPPAPVGNSEGIRQRKAGFTVVQVGRLNPPKDLATLITAVAHARQRVPDLALWIVGDGPQRADLEALRGELRLEDCVTFWGARRDVGSFLAEADLFALSSFSEGLPVSQLEAMAAGLPMLVSAVGGMPEVLPDGEAGTAVPAGDVSAWAAALENHAAQRNCRETWRGAIQQTYFSRFTLEAMADTYLDLYRTLIRM